MEASMTLQSVQSHPGDIAIEVCAVACPNVSSLSLLHKKDSRGPILQSFWVKLWAMRPVKDSSPLPGLSTSVHAFSPAASVYSTSPRRPAVWPCVRLT